MVKHGHRHRCDHGHLLVVVLEDEHHVKVLEAELDPLKVHQLHVLEGAHKRRPLGEVDQAAGGRLEEASLTVRYTLTVEISIAIGADRSIFHS